MKLKLYILILLLIILLSACDLFMTRDPEDPAERKSNFQSAFIPDIVIENLINSFSDKNVQNYLACFVDTSFSARSFHFQPSSEALSQYQFLGQGWNLSDEQRYLNSVIASVPADFPLILSFSDETYSRSGDTVVYSASYSINLPFIQPEQSVYNGNVQFNMTNDARSVWVIYYWQDIKSPNIQSWSELKGKYY